MQAHIINFKTNDTTPFNRLRNHVQPETILVVPGGTISQDINKSTLSKKQLDGIATMGCPLIYSVNLNASIYDENTQITKLLERTVIMGIRYGNEDYGFNRDFNDVPAPRTQAKMRAYGREQAMGYWQRALPFYKQCHYDGVVAILVGAMPSSQLGNTANAYRDGWNDYVIEIASQLSNVAICFHAYHRHPGTDFDATLFKNTLSKMPGIPAYITEAGALTYEQIAPQGHKDDTYSIAAIQTLEAVKEVLRPELDIMGMHPFHHGPKQKPLIDIGLATYYGTMLTPLGEAFFELMKDDAELPYVLRIMDRNGSENPSQVRNIIIILSDGREKSARMHRMDMPQEGDIWTEAMDELCSLV